MKLKLTSFSLKMSTDKIETILALIRNNDTLFRFIAMMTPEEKDGLLGAVLDGFSTAAKAGVLEETFNIMVRMKKEGFLNDSQVASIGSGISSDLLLLVKRRCEILDKVTVGVTNYLGRVSTPCCGPYSSIPKEEPSEVKEEPSEVKEVIEKIVAEEEEAELLAAVEKAKAETIYEKQVRLRKEEVDNRI